MTYSTAWNQTVNQQTTQNDQYGYDDYGLGLPLINTITNTTIKPFLITQYSMFSQQYV